jgi:hypothetical protein
MAKIRHLNIRITEEQHKLLDTKSKQAGYSAVSHYVRAILFLDSTSVEKINDIWNVVVDKNEIS